MIDLNYKPKDKQPEGWQPEEIAVAVLAGLIWIPLAVMIGSLL